MVLDQLRIKQTISRPFAVLMFLRCCDIPCCVYAGAPVLKMRHTRRRYRAHDFVNQERLCVNLGN